MKRYCAIHVDMDRNITFREGDGRKALASVLQDLASKVERGPTYMRLLDPKGSYCGTFKIVEKP